jgi:hypothetical protein
MRLRRSLAAFALATVAVVGAVVGGGADHASAWQKLWIYHDPGRVLVRPARYDIEDTYVAPGYQRSLTATNQITVYRAPGSGIRRRQAIQVDTRLERWKDGDWVTASLTIKFYMIPRGARSLEVDSAVNWLGSDVSGFRGRFRLLTAVGWDWGNGSAVIIAPTAAKEQTCGAIVARLSCLPHAGYLTITR